MALTEEQKKQFMVLQVSRINRRRRFAGGGFSLSSAVVENSAKDTMVLTFSKAATITTDGWSISTDGSALSISSVSDSGTTTPEFTLSRDLTAGEVVTISYDPSAGSTTDPGGRELSAVTDFSVTNNVQGSNAISSNSPVLWWTAAEEGLFTKDGSNNISAVTSKSPATIPMAVTNNGPQWASTGVTFVDSNSEQLNANAVASTYMATTTSPYTIAVVFTINGADTFDPLMWAEYNGNSNSRVGIQMASGNLVIQQRTNSSPANDKTVTLQSSASGTYVLVLSKGTDQLVNAYVNGTKTVTDGDLVFTSFPNSLNSFNLCKLINPDASNSFGDYIIKEIAIFGNELNDTQMQAVRDELNTNWSVY